MNRTRLLLLIIGTCSKIQCLCNLKGWSMTIWCRFRG
ncbi:hypothetical protein SLEP1_g9026 [Rubroshorea leprosula]|uniref:Uncharacterized protein n=1 Tax=Rubroshorea leprosula TaxID=152421 RepID=A0AAV5I9M6_9ROSI|nr:hypothetical protein SLEP1_g9026 [Rubroshorea leprosula]